MNLPSENQSLIELPKILTDFPPRNLDRQIDVTVHEEIVLVAVVLVTTEIAVDDGTFLLVRF